MGALVVLKCKVLCQPGGKGGMLQIVVVVFFPTYLSVSYKQVKQNGLMQNYCHMHGVWGV